MSLGRYDRHRGFRAVTGVGGGSFMVGYSPEMVWLLHIISRVYYCSVWVIAYGITGGDKDRGEGCKQFTETAVLKRKYFSRTFVSESGYDRADGDCGF